jgi:putative hemolysin
MKAIVLYIIISLVPTLLLSSTSDILRLYLGKRGSYTEELITYDKDKKVHINRQCLNDRSSCLALRALSTPQELHITTQRGSLEGHPAAQWCARVGGAVEVLEDKKGNEYNYCRFKDSSLIDSWDLFDNRRSQKP